MDGHFQESRAVCRGFQCPLFQKFLLDTDPDSCKPITTISSRMASDHSRCFMTLTDFGDDTCEQNGMEEEDESSDVEDAFVDDKINEAVADETRNAWIDECSRPNSLKCNNCGIAFGDSENLRRHNKAIHKSMKCPKCPKIFKPNHNSPAHRSLFVNHKHINDFSFKTREADHTFLNARMYYDFKTGSCKICGKEFAFGIWNSFGSHFQSHIGVQFLCTICGERLTTTAGLNSHHRRCHKMKDGYMAITCPIWLSIMKPKERKLKNETL